MKRIFAFLLVCCILCFAGCSKQISFSGKVLDCVEEENRTVYLIETPQQETIALLTKSDHIMHCWIDGVDPAKLSFTPDGGVELCASCNSLKSSYKTATGERVPAYTVNYIEVQHVRTPDTICLDDNTVVEVWQGGGYYSYQLQNGVEILLENSNANFSPIVTFSSAGSDFLTNQTKENIEAFFKHQGALYDLNSFLNLAYNNYLKSDKELIFACWTIQQETVSTAYNNRLIFFSTAVSTPLLSDTSPNENTESKHSTVFDRATGEPIDTLELFSCNEETLADTLFSLCGITDQNLLEELKAAFDANYIIFYPEYLEVYFPQGSLPSEEHTFILSLEYQQGAADILQSWAVPIAE